MLIKDATDTGGQNELGKKPTDHGYILLTGYPKHISHIWMVKSY